ncbi:MAG: T9SS type A sorting domain-containing protein [Saprospiraceae bacterium]|nr:T9SS type A sorting domain-containing protein [Saprospiraceae bacterium]
MMKRLILTLIGLSVMTAMVSAQVVIEDFEGGPKLTWNPFGDGTFNGAVANPPDADPLGINPSAEVGSYTKSGEHAFSLLIAVLDQPLDLTTNNKFKIQVNAPVATSFIFKLEGTGEFLEKRANIAVRDKWIEYTFDISAAASFTTITKIIIFFDPGVMTSTDTYLFDNIVAYPADECAGTVPNPEIIDDFECQRNATYGNPGYYDISVVDNPDPSGINTSSQVGQYRDTSGAFHALVINYDNPIDLTARNFIKLKVWAPKAGRLLVKFEGGTSGAKEKDAQITELNKWVEYTIDFSDQAGANHKQLVFFFNAGVAAEVGDIYYVDDIQLVPKPALAPLEDFEPQKLTWESLQSNPTVFGTFNGSITNPDKTGINTSDNVGSYTKGSAMAGGLEAFIGVVDLTEFPQLDLQVWAPEGATSFTMQLSSPLQGLKSVTRDITETQTWTQLSFNFEEFQTITDFESVRLIFDEGLASTATWYFDNLRQGGATVDPCEGTVANPTFVDDFDCQRNTETTTSALKVIPNPNPGGINPDPLDKVGEYTDPIGEPFAALVYNYGAAGIDLSTFNQLSLKIWSSKAVPMGYKLEGGTSPAKEITDMPITTTNAWVEYVIDFSDQAAANHQRLVIFFNFAVSNTEADVYYIDDIEWKRKPITGCVSDFETTATSLPTWTYFANGATLNPVFEIVDNPNKSGANTSAKVGIFQEAADGETFAGAFADPTAPLLLGASRTVRMKVLADEANTFVLKMEGAVAPAPNSGDIMAMYTTPGQWQELTWDYAKTQGGADIPVGSQYKRVTIIPNFGVTPTETKNYYFDDLTMGEGSCAATTGIFDPVKVEALKVYPNPAYNEVLVEGSENIHQFVVLNAIGQKMAIVQPNGQSNLSITLSHLDKGMYILAGYDEAGRLIANARFVKQ